ncbi:aromatic ring-hydroxylating dioxygenase subunit alpha [Ramlibacter sp. AW1]|uniref:Aromatic ring-hydroxylating dioxygenase subunit alpha n=1 Tax=Ramlibacter aurantiacus TaxID=2801330 RepID=A0A937D4S9_9BURK|nr:aromatic ring-hydroxylating dioxygenase subunit alpha [Ramlibacter aurantiacus]MBL0419198.1 aromatic ring-hydroxylating dioxygenase subunit alpha [Ramlibacter aurantiacus]
MNDTPTRQAASHVAEPIETRRWPEGEWTRIPFWVYTDPAVYAREQERIFGGPSWSYGALEAEIPNTGDFVVTHVGERAVIVVRGENGEVNAFANSCAHRGVAFCRQPRGNTQSFTCPYHQWNYDLTGKVTGIPFRRGYKGQGGMPKDFSIEGRQAPPVHVARRHGVVFLSFDPKAEPFETYLGAQLRYFDRVFDGRELKVLGYLQQRIGSNWKLMFENIKDPYHASVLHVFLMTFGLFRMDQQSAVEMDASGRHSALISRRGGAADEVAAREMANNLRTEYKLQDPRLLDPVREFPGDATVVMQTIWPNLIVQQQSNTLAMRQIVPRGPDAFDLNWTFFGYADDTPEMTQRRVRQANLMGPAGLVSADDSEVLAMSQQGLGDWPDNACIVEMGGRDVQDQPHMITEVAIRAFYKHYIEVMGL